MSGGMGETAVSSDRVVQGDSFYIDSGVVGFRHGRVVRDAQFPGETFAEFQPGHGVVNHGLISIPAGRYQVRQVCRTMQAHELQWKVPAQVPELTDFRSEHAGSQVLVVIHPCCAAALEASIDPSSAVIRKGMASGRIAFLDRQGNPLLRFEPYSDDEFNLSRVWLQRMTDDLVMFEWAVLAATALVPDPATPGGPIVEEFDPSEKAKAPPVYWRSL